MPDETVKVIIKGEDQATPAMKTVGGGLKSLGKIAAGLAVGAAAGIGAAGFAIGKLAMDAAAIEPVRETFQNLTADIGESTQAVIEGMRSASMSTMKDAQLMGAANKLISMGLAQSAAEAADLSKMAVTLGVAMGEQAAPALENFTLMMANQSIPRLDTFGISSGRVRERILELMAATEGMTREEAFKIAVMEEGAKAMERVGDVSKTSAVTMAQLQTIFGNLKDTVGAAFLPVLAALLEPMRDLALTYGPQVQEWAEGFGLWLTDVGIPGAMQFGQNVIRWIGGAFERVAPYIEMGRGLIAQIGEVVQYVSSIVEGTDLAGVFYRLSDSLEEMIHPALGPFLYDIASAIEWVGRMFGIAKEILTGTDLAGIFYRLSDALEEMIHPALGPFLYNVAEAIEWIQETVPGLAQAVGQWITGTALPAIMAFGRQAQEWIQGVAIPALEEFIPKVVELGKGITEWITETAIPAVVEFGQMAREWIQETALPAIVEFGQEVYTWIVETAIPAIQDFAQSAQEWIEGTALPAFEAVVAFVREHAQPVLAGLAAAVLTIVVPAFIAWASSASIAGGATIVALLPVIAVALAVGAVVAGLALAWETNFMGIQEITASVFGAVAGAFEWIKEAVGPAVASIVEAALPAFEQIAGVIREQAVPMLEALSGLWEALKPILTVVAGIIISVLAVAFSTLVGVIQGVVQGVAEGFAGFVMVIQGAIQIVTGVLNVFTGLVELIAGLITGNTVQMTTAWETMKTGVETIIGGLGIALDGLFQAIFGAVLGFLDGFIDGFLDTLGGLLTSILDEKPEWMDAGKELIKGFIQGIKDMAGKVLEAVKGTISAAIALLKALLGLASPSKVMEEMGVNMMEGLIQGIEGAMPPMEMGLTIAGGGVAAAGSRMMVMAPVILQGDRFTLPNGQMNYEALGPYILNMDERLR